MNQLENIEKMEQILDDAESAIQNLTAAAEQYQAVLPRFWKLAAYYESLAWRKDYGDYEQGKFPADLKCGVLSEDAVYDLLRENDELIELLKKISDNK